MTTTLIAAVKDGAAGADEFDRLLEAPETDVNATDEEGHTALYWAAHLGDMGFLAPLLAHPKIKVNFTKDHYAVTPLLAALAQGCSDAVDALLQHPDIDINQPDSLGITPLCRACIKGWTSLALTLLRRPEVDVLADIPTFYASKYGNVTILDALIDHSQSPPVNPPNQPGSTGLHWAAAHLHLAVIERLVSEPETDVNVKDKSNIGRTAIDWALDSINPFSSFFVTDAPSMHMRVLSRLIQAGGKVFDRYFEKHRCETKAYKLPEEEIHASNLVKVRAHMLAEVRDYQSNLLYKRVMNTFTSKMDGPSPVSARTLMQEALLATPEDFNWLTDAEKATVAKRLDEDAIPAKIVLESHAKRAILYGDMSTSVLAHVAQSSQTKASMTHYHRAYKI